MSEYRLLEKGEIIKAGDECDVCCDGWRDAPKWVDVVDKTVGDPAPDRKYPSHRRYRRKNQFN